MSSITIIGPGNIGSAVAALAAKAGASVQILGREAAKAAAVAEQVDGTAGAVGDAITGEIVVLAVPYPALADVAATYDSQLDGKIVVETTNPVDMTTFDSLTVPADSSATAELQALLPGAKVLKAFNTNFAATLATGQTGAAPVTVLVAGDDADARSRLIDLLTAADVAAISVGALKRARELEALGFLQITLAAAGAVGWTGGFAIQQ